MSVIEILVLICILGFIAGLFFLIRNSGVKLPKNYVLFSVGFSLFLILLRFIIPDEMYSKYTVFRPTEEDFSVNLITYFTHGFHLSDFTNIGYICLISTFIGIILTNFLSEKKVLILGLISYFLAPTIFFGVTYIWQMVSDENSLSLQFGWASINAFFTGIFILSFWYFYYHQKLFTEKIKFIFWIVFIISLLSVIAKPFQLGNQIIGTTEIIISAIFTVYYFAFLKESNFHGE